MHPEADQSSQYGPCTRRELLAPRPARAAASSRKLSSSEPVRELDADSSDQQLDHLRRLREGQVPHARPACVPLPPLLLLRRRASADLGDSSAYTARDPFPLPNTPGGTVPRSALVSLSALLDNPHALSVLKALRTAGEEVAVSPSPTLAYEEKPGSS